LVVFPDRSTERGESSGRIIYEAYYHNGVYNEESTGKYSLDYIPTSSPAKGHGGRERVQEFSLALDISETIPLTLMRLSWRSTSSFLQQIGWAIKFSAYLASQAEYLLAGPGVKKTATNPTSDSF